MDLLRKSREYLTLVDISKKLRIARSSVGTSMRKLIKQGEITIQILDNSQRQHTNACRLRIEGFKAR
jgi:DNA-binding transcriptional regulator GbsR (MarR family)